MWLVDFEFAQATGPVVNPITAGHERFSSLSMQSITSFFNEIEDECEVPHTLTQPEPLTLTLTLTLTYSRSSATTMVSNSSAMRSPRMTAGCSTTLWQAPQAIDSL